MNSGTEPKRCPKCGSPIPIEAPQGLCPKCLFQQASFATETGKGGQPKTPPPTRAELAVAFPHLEIFEIIGQGGMGFVFKARQPKLDRFVALKILPAALAADPAFAERFTREGRVLARLNHPNIVTIHDFGQANGFFYLLMEFVDGVNLRQAMKVGRFTPAQALAIVPKICEALQFAHNEGILHRDIKPENILLDSKGRVKIADFGIAKLVGANLAALNTSLSQPTEEGAAAAPGKWAPPQATLTETGKALGTPQYMAPEQLEHPQDVDPRADIYSLGVVFYEMLTGELPIGRFAPPSEKSTVDPRVDEVVLRTLEKERERRTRSAHEVKTQVETITGTASAAAANTSASGRQQNPAGRVQANPGRARHLLRGAVAGLLVLFLSTFAATLITFLMPESYRAGARIRLEAAAPSATTPAQSYDPYLLQTEFETIRSESVLGRVVEHLSLQERWGKRYGFQPKLTTIETRDLLQRALDIRPVRNTMLIDIGFFSDRPNEAAEIANAIADSYVAYWSEQIRAFAQARKEAAEASGGLARPPSLVRVEVIDRAIPPLRPSRPNKPLNVALGIAAGVVLGMAVGLVVGLLSVWKSRVVTPETATSPTPKPDRFWRRLAVVGLSAIAIPIGLMTSMWLAAAILDLFRTQTRQQHLIASPGNVSNSESESKLVISPEQFTPAHEPGRLDWGFKVFVPPDHLGSLLFVRWTNGVPKVDPGFSAYFKIGKAGGIDVPFCSLSCYPIPASQLVAMTNAESHQMLNRWGFPDPRSAAITNAVQWNVNLGLGFTSSKWIPMPPYHRMEFNLPQTVRSGHQRAFRLVDFDRTEGEERGERSGIELRVLLQPLRSPPIRMFPNEIDRTNYIAGSGLAGTVEETLESFRTLPLDP